MKIVLAPKPLHEQWFPTWIINFKKVLSVKIYGIESNQKCYGYSLRKNNIF